MNTDQRPGCAAFVLAGGRSRRMGRQKALILWKGKTWLRHAVEALRAQAFPVVRIIRNDIIPATGPLGGIYTALSDCREPWAFFIPCDMPGLNLDRETLGWWIAEAFKPEEIQQGKVDVVFTQSQRDSRPQSRFAGFPLMIRSSMHEQLLGILASGECSLQKFVSEFACIPLRPPEKWSLDFKNINTPAEWDRFTSERK